MRFILLLVFIVVPLLEIALLIKVGQEVGFWPTFGLIVVMAAAGAALLHRQSLAVLRRAVGEAEHGRPPIAEVLDGACLFLAGGLLLTPGLLTDAAGLMLLIPWVRRRIGRWAFERLFGAADVRIDIFTPDPVRPKQEPRGPVIDGEFERLDEKTRGPARREIDTNRRH